MNESEYNELRGAGWRRPLAPDEEARLQQHLAAHPDAQADWEEDLALNHLLAQTPDAPLSSNFTARVLHAVELDSAAAGRAREKAMARWWPRHWLPRAAFASLVASLGLLGYRQHELNKRAELVRDAVEVSRLAAKLPNVELWQDFEAINRASLASLADDEELWAALK